jgi:N4-(beta-N-acetylglucosaminyl)-L-asparaginase
MKTFSRRDFLRTGAGAAALAASGGIRAGARAAVPAAPRVVASGNGLRATEKAMTIIKAGGDRLDAVIAGVNIVEDDPNDMSVGYGGLPNEDGVVGSTRRSCTARPTQPGPWLR